MKMCSVASKTLVPFLFSDLQHQFDDALYALTKTDCTGSCLVELFVAPNIVAFFGYPREIVHVCKRKKVENMFNHVNLRPPVNYTLDTIRRPGHLLYTIPIELPCLHLLCMQPIHLSCQQPREHLHQYWEH